MNIGETVDRCGIRLLTFLIIWLILARLDVPLPDRVLASVGATLCAVGAAGGRAVVRTENASKKTKSFSVRSLRSFFASALTRKNARRFMTAALILLVFGTVLPFGAWYYVMAGVNVLLTLLCFAFGRGKTVR